MNDLDRALVAIQGLAAKIEADLTATLAALAGAANLSPLRAINYDPSTSDPELWCDHHEQPIKACREAGHRCDGWPVPAGDPTGEAAINGTRGPHPDKAKLTRLIADAYDALLEADAIRQRWTRLKTMLDNAGRVGDDTMWCISCWRNKEHHEPVHKDHRTARLCRWCAGYKRDHHGQLPPVRLLAKRHRGDRITQADIDRYGLSAANA